MLIPVDQAAADALAAWLTTSITGSTVLSEWAAPDAAPANRTISILPLGKREDEWHDPVQLSYSAPVNGLTTSVWRIANCTQVYQLDVWCTSPADRLDVEAQLDLALHAGARALGQSYPAFPQQDPFDNDVLVAMSGAWAGGTASFLFDGPIREDTEDANATALYRTTRRGTGWFALVMSHVDPPMSSISLKLRTLNYWTAQAASVPAMVVGLSPPQGFQYGYGRQLDTPAGANPTFSGL